MVLKVWIYLQQHTFISTNTTCLSIPRYTRLARICRHSQPIEHIYVPPYGTFLKQFCNIIVFTSFHKMSLMSVPDPWLVLPHIMNKGL